MPESTFGFRLLHLRTSLHMTTEEIAHLCGIHPATWNTWEHGALPRNQGTAVEKISQATGVDAGWLLWGRPIILDLPSTQMEFDFNPRAQLRAVGTVLLD